MQDCKEELHSLLLEDVRLRPALLTTNDGANDSVKRLAGASLLVFANKQDIEGSMSDSEIATVRLSLPRLSCVCSP